MKSTYSFVIFIGKNLIDTQNYFNEICFMVICERIRSNCFTYCAAHLLLNEFKYKTF